MKQLNFYFKYAWRSVLRGSQRSFFAVLCIAVGVAALVAIQVLEQSINDTLLGDANERAGGNIVLTTRGDNAVTQNDLDAFKNLQQRGTISDWTTFTENGTPVKGNFGFPPTLYTVDPQKFPLYGQVGLIQSQGGNFQQLLSKTGNIVVSKTLWEKLHLTLGQKLTLIGNSTGKTLDVTVAGETGVDEPGLPFGDSGTFFGFAMASQATSQEFLAAGNLAPTVVYFKTATDAQAAPAKQAIEQATSYKYDMQTSTEIEAQIAQGIDQVSPLLTYVGLLSLLIGGIGVVNTMLVVIGRRTTEIATVKALGLKQWQTILIFTIEAGCIGAIGSVVGIVIGELLSLVFNQVAAGVFQRPLVWQIYPLPILTGFIVGIVTALVFGFLPSYAAGKVRPGVVLRMQTGALPRVGGVASVVIVVLMVLALGLTAGLITGDVSLGLEISFGTLIGSMILIGILWLIVWLVGKFPAPLGPSFKMAMRSFSRHRGRTATTVAVIVVGIFSVSFVVILAEGIKDTIRQVFDVNLGFNVVGIDALKPDVPQLQSTLSKLPGYQSGYFENRLDVQITQVNGQDWSSYQGASNYPDQPNFSLTGRGYPQGATNGQAKSRYTIISGRDLQPSDADSNVIVVNQNEANSYGLKVGDKITVNTSSDDPIGKVGASSSSSSSTSSSSNPVTETLTIIGISGASGQVINLESHWVAPYNAVEKLGSPQTLIFLLVDSAKIDTALNTLQSSSVGKTMFLLNLTDLINSFTRILDQFLAFPTMLSLLSLFSGAVLIANNVALAMLERRTEIGVLKAIGAKQRRVMSMILWESGLTGLLGGLIGVGLALLILYLVGAVGKSSGGRGSSLTINWSPTVAALLILMSIGLAVIATVASAWSAVREKPLVVLRYE